MNAGTSPRVDDSPLPDRIGNFFSFANYYKKNNFPDYAVILVKELLLASKNHNSSYNKSEDVFQIISNDKNFKKWVSENINFLK